MQQTARIVAQVEHQPLQARTLAIGIRLVKFFKMAHHVRRGFFLELGDAQVAVTRFDGFRLDALHLDLVALDGDLERLRLALAQDGELDRGLRLAAHLLDGVVQRHAFHRRFVELDDEVARLDTGAIGGRVLDRGDDLDEAVLHADLDAEATEFTLRRNLQILEGVGVQIGGMRIEIGQHAADGMGDE